MLCADGHQRARALAAVVVALFIGGCEVGGPPSFTVITGPALPSPIPTGPTYAWDTDEELQIWVKNPVTRGPVPVSLVGLGSNAFIRIEPRLGLDGWVLRGPDLSPPAGGVRTIKIWYRWRLDPALSPGAATTFTLAASFEVLNPLHPPDQPTAYAQLQPASEWTAADLVPGSFRHPLDVKYVYLHQSSTNPGVFEIDRIELVQ